MLEDHSLAVLREAVPRREVRSGRERHGRYQQMWQRNEQMTIVEQIPDEQPGSSAKA
jgi:hypothetical protein